MPKSKAERLRKASKKKMSDTLKKRRAEMKERRSKMKGSKRGTKAK